MANVNINQMVIDRVNNEDLLSVLNTMMEQELAKSVDEIDTAFVDDCVDAIIALEQENNNFVALIPLMSSGKFLQRLTNKNSRRFKEINIFARAAIIAAIIAGSTFTANAAVEAVTGVNVITDIVDKIEQTIEKTIINKGNGIEIIEGDDFDDEITTKPEETTTQRVETTTAPEEESTTNPPLESTTQPEQSTEQPTLESTTENQTTKEDKTTQKQTTAAEEKTTQPTTTQKAEWDDTEQSKETTTMRTTQPAAAPAEVEPTTKAKDESQPQEAVFTGLYASFDEFKLDYIYNEEIEYDKIQLEKIYSDGSREPLSIDECTYTKGIDMTSTHDATIKIIYNHTTLTVDITVRPDEETRGSRICNNALFDYLLTDKGAYITAYNGTKTSVDLTEVDGNTVYAIAQGVFKDKSIRSITAPDVVKIGDSAFENCSRLSSVILGDKLAYIGECAFKNTAITTLTLPENMTQIPASICEGCRSLKTVYALGEVVSIGDYAFSDCTSLESFVGIDKVKAVGMFAFYDDSNLTVTIPDGLEQVGQAAFFFCQSMIIDAVPSGIKEMGNEAFAYCVIDEIVIPDGIDTIPYGAFRNTGAKRLVIPDGVKSIGPYAFFSIKAEVIRIPRTVSSIGAYAFYSNSVSSVYFGNTDTAMVQNVFLVSDKLKLYVYKDTAPYIYAVENGIAYEILD